MAEKYPGQRIWNMTDDELMEELTRPVHPDDRDGYLALRVAVGRMFCLLIDADHRALAAKLDAPPDPL